VSVEVKHQICDLTSLHSTSCRVNYMLLTQHFANSVTVKVAQVVLVARTYFNVGHPVMLYVYN
jgi:hypothetical protein